MVAGSVKCRVIGLTIWITRLRKMQKHIPFHYIVGVILVAVSVYALIYTSEFIQNHPITGSQEYDIFRDLLTMVLTIVGVIISGVFLIIYDVLSKTLQRSVESKAHNEIQREKASLYIRIGYTYWNDFRNRNDPQDLEQAIDITNEAFNIVKKMDEKENEELLCTIKNNLAYYLALQPKEKRKSGDDKIARDYAKYAYDRISNYPKHKEDWTDTYQFVQNEFPSKVEGL